MFPQNYHGTIFNVSYNIPENGNKDFINCHLITSLKSFDLIKSDWKSVIMTVDIDSIANITTKGNLVIMDMINNYKFPQIIIDGSTSKKLPDALKKVLSIPKQEIRFLALSLVLPTFNFPDRSGSITLHKNLMELSKEILNIFKPSEIYTTFKTSVSGSFVDLLSCGFRIRYSNTDSGINKVSCFSLDVEKRILYLWTKTLIKIMESKINYKDLFYARITENIIDTILMISNRLSINSEDLSMARNKFTECGEFKSVLSSSKKIIKNINELDEKTLQSDPPFSMDYLELIMNIIVVGLSGIIVGVYQSDLDDLAEKTVNFTRELFVNKGNIQKLKQELEKSSKSYLTEMLRYLDGQRYESDFQFVYCTWETFHHE